MTKYKLNNNNIDTWWLYKIALLQYCTVTLLDHSMGLDWNIYNLCRSKFPWFMLCFTQYASEHLVDD